MPTPRRTLDLALRVADAIKRADRCEQYYDDDGCDGLDGCDACLQLAAEAVLDELGR